MFHSAILTFDERDYDIVLETIKDCGGAVEDFETDDVVNLGDDEDYIDLVKTRLDEQEIEYEISEIGTDI